MRAVCTPSMRSDNSLHATSNSVGARWHAVGAPRKRHCHRGRAVTSPRQGKCKIIRYIFFSIFVRSHGALRNFKSPCQRRGIAVECDRGFTHRFGLPPCWEMHERVHASSVAPVFALSELPARNFAVFIRPNIKSQAYNCKQATGLDAWASRVKCPTRFVSHLHDIYIYIYIYIYMSCL